MFGAPATFFRVLSVIGDLFHRQVETCTNAKLQGWLGVGTRLSERMTYPWSSLPRSAWRKRTLTSIVRMGVHGTLLPDVIALQEMECDLLLRPFALHATMAMETRRQDF